jgi:sugar transferase (PEP-CTERM system associated)
MNLSINSYDRSEARKVPGLPVDHIPRAIFRFPGTKRRILILGAGSLGKGLFQLLRSRRKIFTDVVGVLAKESEHVGEKFAGMEILGTMDQLIEVVERHRVDTIAVCLKDRRAILPVQTLLDLKSMGVDIRDGHHLYEEESGRLPIDELKPSAIIFSTGFRRGIFVRIAKRTVDLLVSTVGLVVLFPVLALIGILIKLDSPGPIFYQQVRVGLRAQPYMIWKFRSMFRDAENDGARWALEEDPRISRVGWWMRKWRLDEIPQLFNVIKGEMSLVGPRPERPIFVEELRSVIPYYDIRHAVRPGITGWAQTQFRYGASAQDAHVKLQYDLYYVKNPSLALDFRILMDTIRVILLGHGAR